jgi:type IV secretory pathway protease TraF
VKHAPSGVLRGSPARALHARCRSACSRTSARAVVAVSVAGVVLAVLLELGLHVNPSSSVPRGPLPDGRRTTDPGVWVVASVSPQKRGACNRARLSRTRAVRGRRPARARAGRCRRGRCGGDRTRGGDSRRSRSCQLRGAGADSLGCMLPRVAWGRYAVGADKLWLVRTRVPNRRAGRYLGPISTSQVWSVARPVWTVD